MRLQAAVAAFHVPEFLKTDIGPETALGNMIIKQLQAYAVRDDGGLANRDVGERPCMDHAGLVFSGAHKGRINCISHLRGHCAANLKILGGYRLAVLVKCQGDLVQPSPAGRRDR